jgi:cell division protein FtsA
MKNVIIKDLPAGTIVNQEMINELEDTNRSMSYTDLEILDAATQEYKVDSQYQLDPVGIQCSRLEGNYLNILWRKSFYRNLNKCFENAGIRIAELYLAPMALADSILTEAEKRSGCVLVDLGADTTTVSVYYKNILRHLAVIPLGGNNITKDIATMQMEEKEAEAIKLKYGCAYTDSNAIDNTLELKIDDDRKIESRKLIDIIEGRLEEIIENVRYQVPSEYLDKLIGGIILTGGGSNMKEIETAFRNYTHISKIRVAKFVTQTINSKNADINAHDGTMNTILGLLEKGDYNCAGEDITNDLFNAGQEPTRPTRVNGGNPRPGVIPTEAERKAAAEEEARKKKEKEEEEARKKKEKEEEEARIAKEKRENNLLNKIWKSAKKIGEKLIVEE